MKYKYKYIDLIFLVPILDIGTGLFLFLIGLPQESIRSNLIVFILPMILRLIILLLSINFILRKKNLLFKTDKVLILFIILSFIVTLIECMSFIDYQNISKYILSLVNYVKIIFYPFVFVYFIYNLNIEFIQKWLNITSILAPLAVIIGLFGIGFTQYGGLATIGVWPYGSGNALSSIFFILSVYNFYIFSKTDNLFHLSLGLLIAFAVSLTASKMGILSTVLSLILMILFFKKKNLNFYLFI